MGVSLHLLLCEQGGLPPAPRLAELPASQLREDTASAGAEEH